MVKYLLDTNTCIRFLTGRSQSVLNRMITLAPSQINLCSVVRYELAYGAFRSAKPVENQIRQMGFCDRFHSWNFDNQAAEICGKVRAELANLGTPIGPYDLMIASIAIARDAVLVTHNTKEFSRVPGLSIEDWE